MEQKPALIFDLDGTLWDACKPIAESWTIVGRKYFSDGYEITPEMARTQMGRTMDEIASSITLGEIDPVKGKQFIDECFAYEVEYLIDHPGSLFEGELEALRKLKDAGYPLYIVSNCQSGYIENFLPLAPDLFLDHMCWSDTKQDKNVTIRALMQRHGIEHAIYIGDTEKDGVETRKAGLPFCFAAYGFGQTDIYDGKADSFPALFEELERICRLFWPNENKTKSSEEDSKYLNSEQIKAIHLFLREGGFDLPRQTELMAMIDAYVQENGTADVEYDKAMELYRNTIALFSDQYDFSKETKALWSIALPFEIGALFLLLGLETFDNLSTLDSPMLASAFDKHNEA